MLPKGVYKFSGKRFNKSPLTLDPILVLKEKDKSTLKLTNEAMTETKRLDESVCDSILHEFSNLFDQMLKNK